MNGYSKTEAETVVDRVDREQRDFFKSVYGKKEASSYEFDIIINFDHIPHPEGAAEIVVQSFRVKFQ